MVVEPKKIYVEHVAERCLKLFNICSCKQAKIVNMDVWDNNR